MYINVATRWKTYSDVPPEGIRVGNPATGLHVLGVVPHANGIFAAVPTRPEVEGQAEPIEVVAGRPYYLSFTRIDPATTAKPFTVLWGPHR